VLSLDFKPAGAYMPDCTAWRVEEYAKGFVSHKYAPEFGAKSEGAPVSVYLLLRSLRSRAASSTGEGCIGVGGPPRKLLTNSLRISIHALRIEGRSNVNSPRTTRSFENNASSMHHAITSFHGAPLSLRYCSGVSRG
jgi:hypothetical protein